MPAAGTTAHTEVTLLILGLFDDVEKSFIGTNHTQLTAGTLF
jgi:hypothetical protein